MKHFFYGAVLSAMLFVLVPFLYKKYNFNTDSAYPFLTKERYITFDIKVNGDSADVVSYIWRDGTVIDSDFTYNLKIVDLKRHTDEMKAYANKCMKLYCEINK